MTYLIDARLDRLQPYLRILDRNTGAVCVSLEGEALEELREQGDLDLQELSTNELLRTKGADPQSVPVQLCPALRPEPIKA